MNYQVLYRKWRPQTFDDVVGQKYITDTLANEVDSGNIAHAYLFTGTRGTGKTTCAKILAKAVNCQNPKKGNPCNECEACVGIDRGSVTDVTELDAASNNSVDDIRSMIDETVFLPVNVKYRVYILDEVHMLSKSASNAFLKTLEEPPPHVIFILATTDPHKLLPTIHSRCQRFDFKRILPRDIAARLKHIAEKEGFDLDDDAAMLIARLADGGLRDAISLLDQCAVSNKKISLEAVGRVAGVADKNFLFALADCIKSQKVGPALEIIDRLHSDFSDMAILCSELLEHMRNLMLVKTVGDASSLIVANAEDYKKIEDQAQAFSLAEILDAMVLLKDSSYNLTKVHNKRTAFEIAMVRLCSSRQVKPEEEAKLFDNPVSTPEKEEDIVPFSPPTDSEPEPESEAEDPPPIDENQIFFPFEEEIEKPFLADDKESAADSKQAYEKWEELMEKLFDCDPAMWGALQNVFAYMEDGKLCLSSAHINTAESLYKSEGSSCALLKVAEEVCGEGVNICFVPAKDPIEDLESILNKVNNMKRKNTF